MTMTMTMIMTTTVTDVSAATLPRLLTWLSPAFPTGSFAYSHGLEWAVEQGDVACEADVLTWLGDVMVHGAGHTDAVLLRHAWRAGTAEALVAVAEWAAACAPALERRDETLNQGDAFVLAARVWGAPLLDTLAARRPAPRIAWPVALGALARAHDVPEDLAVIGQLQAFAATIVSAAVRLVPLGQTAGLRIVAALEPLLHQVAVNSRDVPLDGIGGLCFRADIAAMRHETQYTRLFRT